MATSGRGVFAVVSAGRVLRVDAPNAFATWWPRLAPHLPGVRATTVTEAIGSGPPDLTLPAVVTERDARRLVNAGLHRLHLGYGTVCVHAVAAVRPDGAAALLLGGHGAGKSLVGLALVENGWRSVAGDVALVEVVSTGPPRLLGGTAAYLVRPSPARHWFPALPLGPSGTADVDLSDKEGRTSAEPVSLVVTALVDVDGDARAAAGGAMMEVDRHTAATVWLRASGYLLDRVLDDGDVALREMEDVPAVRRRVALARTLAARTSLSTLWGTPRGIAARVEGLARAELEARK